MALHFRRTVPVCLLTALAGMRLFAVELSSTDLEQLRKARQGEAIQLQIATNRQMIAHLPVEIAPEPGPQYLISDRPEYFPTNGIALREDVTAGLVRLYVYHVPESAAGGKVISAAVANTTAKPLTVRMLRRAFPKPGTDYQRVAKEALKTFLAATAKSASRTIHPGEKLILDPSMDAAIATTDQLVHGFYEFEVNGPATVTVFQRDPGQSSLAVLDSLPLLPSQRPGKTSPSGAGRGKFPNANFKVTLAEGLEHIDTVGGPLQLVLADGRRDPWMRGRDSIDNRPSVVNSGNYGALYRIVFKRTSSDHRKLAVLFSKLDIVNQWCGPVAAAVTLRCGTNSAEVISVPESKPSLNKPGEVSVLAILPPLPHGISEEVELVYSPPGSACLPTPILLIPFE